MSHWNHRVVRDPNGLRIFDVYYNDEGRPQGTHVVPSYVYGDTLEELQDKLEIMAAALECPVLDSAEIGAGAAQAADRAEGQDGTAAAHRHVPADGLVPDAKTAIRIAVAVWEPVYGAQAIARQSPHRATLVEGTWRVSGTLPARGLGGTAVAEISQADGRILRLSHGR